MGRCIASDKVAIYIRWSTEDQGLGHTLEIQRESCRYYCLSQGWAPREELTYIDDGYSGATLERPALTRLRQAIRSGLVDCVVTYKLDRLSRNIKDMINLVLDEWEERCSLRSTQEPVDTTSDAGRMFFTMLGSFADFERATIRTRTWSGKLKNAEKGRNPGIPYPFGFEKGPDGSFVIVEAEAAVVRRIYDEYLKGRSCRQIARALNSEFVLSRNGRPWADADISRLLRNPLYAGCLVYNRKAYSQRRKRGQLSPKPPEEVIAVRGAAPEIIDEETWAQAERIRRSRPRVDRGRSARTQSSPYLLSGLLRCPCGHAWVGIQGGKNGERFYICAGARTVGPARCSSRSIKAERLDAFVLARVRETWPVKDPFRAEIFGRIAVQRREYEAKQQSLRQRAGGLESAMQRFRQDYKLGKIPAELYLELTAESRRELEETRALLDASAADWEAAAGAELDLVRAEAWYARLDVWESLTLTEKQQVLRMLIEQITLSRPKGSEDLTMHLIWRLPAPGGQGEGPGRYLPLD